MSSPSFADKIVSRKEIGPLAEKLRGQGKKIITTNGCFDLLHLGHMTYLDEAKRLGDCLIVGVNADSSVKGLKGDTRPIFPEHVRAQQVASLESVDHVVIFSEKTPEVLLGEIKPTIHVKGGDYRPEDLPERTVVEKGGGKVVVVSLLPGFSTSGLIETLR